jgi:hypothetical protein
LLRAVHRESPASGAAATAASAVGSRERLGVHPDHIRTIETVRASCSPARINGNRHGRPPALRKKKSNYPMDEESRGMVEGRSPSAETCASNSMLQQNPVISKNLPWIHHHDPLSSSSGCKNHTND